MSPRPEGGMFSGTKDVVMIQRTLFASRYPSEPDHCCLRPSSTVLWKIGGPTALQRSLLRLP